MVGNGTRGQPAGTIWIKRSASPGVLLSIVSSIPPTSASDSLISQRGDEFTLFAAVDPETRHILHAAVAPTRNYLTTWRFFEQLRELYGRLPPIVVTNGAIVARLAITRSSAGTAYETASNAGSENLNGGSTPSIPRFPAMTSKPPTTGYSNSPGRGTRA